SSPLRTPRPARPARRDDPDRYERLGRLRGARRGSRLAGEPATAAPRALASRARLADHSAVRFGAGRRVVVASALAAGLAGFGVAGSATAQNRSSTVALRLTVSGSGTVRVTGLRPFTCRATSCRHAFHVRRGTAIVVRASGAKGWKLTAWGGAC